MSRRYVDFDLVRKFPNKYNLTPKSIKKLKILDWDRLKKETWKNDAMLNGTWYCHTEGCMPVPKGFDADEDEFWIGFRKDDNKVDCHWWSYGGMCGYNFEKFYDGIDIENIFDMHVQANTVRWLNNMIDEGILGI